MKDRKEQWNNDIVYFPQNRIIFLDTKRYLIIDNNISIKRG